MTGIGRLFGLRRSRALPAASCVLVASVLAVGCAERPIGGADGWTLYAGLIKTQGYTVGSPLASSGLHLLSREGGVAVPPADAPAAVQSDAFGWYHLGWNTPRISGIAANPMRPLSMFLAGGNGVLRTLDGGVSWKIVTGWQVTEVQDVAVDALSPDVVYLASAYGVWRSTDNGETWNETNSGITRKYTQTIETDRTVARRVLAGTERGIFLSDDAAGQWRLVGPEGLNVMDLQQSFGEPDVWAAATDGDGIWLSTDGGLTWRQQQPTAGMSFYSVAIDPGDDDRIAGNGWDTSVFITRNGGGSWARIGDQLPTPHGYELAFDWNDPDRLWVATLEEGVFFTDDDGRTWTPAGLDGTLVFDMLFVRNR